MNAYERSSREPGADTLRRIAAAAGMELEARRSCGMDVHRAGDVLERVLDLAEALPRRRRGQLTYPSPRRHAA